VVGGESVGKMEGDLRLQSWVGRVAVLRLGATLWGSRPACREVGTAGRGGWKVVEAGREAGRASVAAGLPSHASRHRGIAGAAGLLHSTTTNAKACSCLGGVPPLGE